MKKEIFKKILPYAVAVVVFILLAIIYASPVLDGKVLNAGDSLSGDGMVHETGEYQKESGEFPLWVGTMFCGMPNYQLTSAGFPKPVIDVNYGRIVDFGFTGILGMLIGYFVCFFILFRSFKVNPWLSIVGSLALTFSSYFFVIIAAGHLRKVVALAYLAPIIGGFYLIFQKKYGWGCLITLIFSTIGLLTHPQMTMYVFMLIGVLFCAELFIHIKEKRFKDLLIGTLLFAGCLVLGLGTQMAPFMANREYIAETMRGGHSELAKESDKTNKTEGLDLSYITQYSYGIDETSTLLIPGSKGYASAYNVGTNSKIYNAMVQHGMPRKQAADYCRGMPTYWGGVEGTSGPVYVGAIVCFLFILGILIVKGPYKWALIIATVFSILLAWGYNFMPLTELFAKYFPMYAKFRAVESILIVAEFTMPLLGFLAIKEIMDQKGSKSYDGKKMSKKVLISAGITACLCLIAIIVSPFLDYSWGRDADIFANWPEWLSSALIAERASLLRISALRSLIFVVISAAIVWLYSSNKLKFGYFAALLGVLVLVDMWPIDRKFFNDDNFFTQKNKSGYFAKRPYEELISQDTDPNFRVYNLTDPQGPFNESRTSYHFKSIGGYSAVKLRRYQDIIDAHISPETNPMLKSIRQIGDKLVLEPNDTNSYPVLNMLNMKYAVVGNEQPMVVVNPNAMGNAWFVDSVVIANTPNEESDALNTINLHNTLVTDVKFKDFVKDFKSGHDSTAQIHLTKYAPDQLEYDYTASAPGTVVFSEMYYPHGWNAYIDDKPVDHFRANYTLRALNVPAGQHHIRFEFHPATVEKWGKVSIACKYIVLLVVLSITALGIINLRKKNKTPLTNTSK